MEAGSKNGISGALTFALMLTAGQGAGQSHIRFHSEVGSNTNIKSRSEGMI